jgi:hypothetical protein
MIFRDLRAEAEPETRVARLPSLRITRKFSCAPDPDGFRGRHGTLKTKALLHFSDDISVVHFRLAFRAQYSGPAGSAGKWLKGGCSSSRASLDRFREPLLESLESSDLRLFQRMEQDNLWPMHTGGLWSMPDVSFGPVLNSIEVPWKDINFAEEDISIN